MGFKILNKQILAPGIKRMDVFAPDISRKIRPGQFISIAAEEGDERVALPVVDADAERKTISIIFQEFEQTTQKLGTIPINEEIFSVLGPLGRPAKIEKKGTVVCIATGFGAAQLLPMARAFKKAGNKIIGIIGAKTKRALMLEPQMRIACDRIFITTNDGSYEKRGLVTDVLKQLIDKKEVDLIYAIGSVEMMQAVCQLTKDKNIETRVQLNPVMVDCIGVCGSCRVKVGGKILLACLDGPEFDGHKVDFEHFNIRIKAYEETQTWYQTTSSPSPTKKEPRILTKFLSGILKE